jgi:predicted DNA-binding protein
MKQKLPKKAIGRPPLAGTEKGNSQRISFVISNELDTKLRQYCRAYSTTVSEVIREGIEKVLSNT